MGRKLRNIRLDIEYEGTHYHGWQVQANAVSVSGTIEEALEQVLQHRARLLGSGRTDAGVHALGQVANFTTEREIPAENLQLALNRLLPRDIVIRRAADVPLEFHARRDAIERTYRYQFFVGSHPSALYRTLTLHIRRPLNVSAMRQAAGAFVGSHDFTSFRSRHCDAENPVRTVFSFDVLNDPPFVFLDVKANAFLRNQVRIMASTLLEVGLGRCPASDVPRILEAKNRDLAGPTLKPRGLLLVHVRYPGQDAIPMPRTPSSLA